MRLSALQFVPLSLLIAAFGCDDDDDSAPLPDAQVDSTIEADGARPDAQRPDAATDAVVADAAEDDATESDAADLDASPDAAADAAIEADADYPHDPAAVRLAGPCPPAQRFGGFKVEANDAEGYTAIDGVVKDSIVAGQIPEVALAEGDCQLLRRRRLICEPTCEPGMTCDLGGECVPQPRGQDMGAVVFRGLVQPVSLTALQPGNTYFFTRLAHPGFTPDRVIQVTNTEGFIAPIELFGVGVKPLVPVEETWVLTEGQALTIHWDAPPASSRARLFFELNIDQHGLTPLNLVCDLPDTGQATVPVAMTDALIAAGVTGFPTGRVARRTVDSLTQDQRCVELVVSSVRPIAVEVTGHLPCTRNEDCPSGRCNLTIQQCE